MARSRYKFDRSQEFIPGYKFGGGHWCSVAVQTILEPVIYHGAGVQLRADVRVRVRQPLQICLECRSKSKNRDKQLTHIVRVSFRVYFNVMVKGHPNRNKISFLKMREILKSREQSGSLDLAPNMSMHPMLPAKIINIES